MAILAVFTLTSFPCLCLLTRDASSRSQAAILGHGVTVLTVQVNSIQDAIAMLQRVTKQRRTIYWCQQRLRCKHTGRPGNHSDNLERNAGLAHSSMKFWSLAKGSQRFPSIFHYSARTRINLRDNWEQIGYSQRPVWKWRAEVSHFFFY